MRIRLLGTAAGGGVPQWNCNCPVCSEARRGVGRVLHRTQSSVAISANGRHWFLLNASPDIRSQIESFPALGPGGRSPRGACIEGVLLTNADLDHSLGLLLLREGNRLHVHATPQVQAALTNSISIAPVLSTFCDLEWVSPPTRISPLHTSAGTDSGLLYQAILLDGKPPRFVKEDKSAPPEMAASGHTIGYRIVDPDSRGRLLFLPNVATLDDALLQFMTDADAILFDGTFWSENEMLARGVGINAATAMGHIPISGATGSLHRLAHLDVKTKIYVHVNNTNPVLIEDSPERAEVKRAGCEVGRDGMEIVI